MEKRSYDGSHSGAEEIAVKEESSKKRRKRKHINWFCGRNPSRGGERKHELAEVAHIGLAAFGLDKKIGH